MKPSIKSSIAVPSIRGDDAFLIRNSRTDRDVRATSGQLEAVAMRFREELAISLRRHGIAAVATVNENLLTVAIEQSLSAAEHDLMARAEGRAFFQHYVEELAEQIYPSLLRHVESILPCAVTTMHVQVDCDHDRLIFACGLQPRSMHHWPHEWADSVPAIGQN